MDYEKAYKEALERAREFQKSKDGLCVLTAESIFPELGESEDELTWLTNFIEEEAHSLSMDIRDNEDRIKLKNLQKSLAWLEKQKTMDKEIVFRPLIGTDIRVAAKQALEKIEIGKKVVLAFNGAYIPVNDKTVSKICDEYDAWIEKQGEQKATDKVEPKFHEGDWIIDKQGIVHQIEKVIENVTNNTFAYDLVGGGYFNEEVKSCRLWTIDDAKDGDVLYSLDSKQPFIFKHRKPNEQAAVYCGINTYGKFFIGNTKDCVITTDKYIPADKFQRDLLFKKIEEAGYEWDDDKKELKKVDKKIAWSEDDEEMCQETIDWFEKKCFPYALEYENPARESIRWLKSLKERLS